MLACFLISVGCQSMNKKDFAIGDESFKVQVTSYKPGDGSDKSLVILAPTGGTTLIDRSYASTFCGNGYDVYIINSWTGDNEFRNDLNIHQLLYTKAQKAVALTVNEIKSPFIGLLGTSVGGLHAAVSASKIDKLNAVFIIAAGAPITDIIVASDQKAMKIAKEKRYQKYGFKNDNEYLSELKKQFHLEPMQLGEGYKNKQLGMLIATEDTTVPTHYQRELQKFWNPRVTLTYDSSHFWGIVKMWLFETDRLVKFFEDSYAKNKIEPR